MEGRREGDDEDDEEEGRRKASVLQRVKPSFVLKQNEMLREFEEVNSGRCFCWHSLFVVFRRRRRRRRRDPE